MINVIFLGPPGSGKGTQASLISKKLSIPSISTGDMLRYEVSVKSEIGILANKIMNEGGLVPDNVVIDIIKARISKSDCDNGFILDGFPRNMDQALSLDLNLSKINKNLTAVVQIDVPDEIIIKRISGRFSCKDCGAVYNKFFSNIKELNICDNCKGSNFLVRSDDNIDTVTKRLDIYHKETKVLVEFYEKKHLIYKVDGLKSIDLVTGDIENILISSSKSKILLNI